jgi:Holliday junction resolvasome RuvABC endonuclease subunit
MNQKTYPDLVLAVAPTTRGFAFVLFEGPLTPFDWGRKGITGPDKNLRVLKKVQAIIERFHPQVIVLEDLTGKSVRRPAGMRALSLALRYQAEAAQMEVHRYDRATIRRHFEPVGARTKPEIAQAIARQIPAFHHYLPPIRKIWMSEHPRQSLFDAAALGMTYYQTQAED